MNKRSSPIISILSFGKSYKIWLFTCIIFSLLDVAVNILIPYAGKKIIDIISIDNGSEEFLTSVWFMITLLLMGTINIFFRKLSISRFTEYTIQNLRNNLTAHIQKLPFNSFKKHHSGDLASRANSDIDLITTLLTEISDFIYDPLIFICAVIYGLILNWKLLLVTVIVLGLATVLNNFATKPISKFSSKLQKEFGKANSLIQDTVKGIYIVKSFNLKKVLQNDYQSRQTNLYNLEMQIVKRRLFTLIITTFLLIFPLVVINLYGGSLTFAGEMTIGEFTAFLAIISYLGHPVIRLIKLVSNMKAANGAAERVNEILNYKIEDTSKDKYITNKETDIAVAFENVSFSYDDKTPVLTDINFKLPKNKTVALVGVSGGGKSTILNLVCGFYNVTDGKIKVFGNEINKIDLKTLRSQISMVTQDTHIYPKTVAENIGYGKKNSTREEIINAAKISNAHNFIVNLSDGYDTILTESGSNLSGGQKQRITIARAMLKDAPILLLDEPTSALDNNSEKLIDETLKKFTKNKSVLVVAHRFSTIKNADEILLLNNGKISERGTHDELIENDTLYRKLYLKQYKASENNNLFKGVSYNV